MAARRSWQEAQPPGAFWMRSRRAATFGSLAARRSRRPIDGDVEDRVAAGREPVDDAEGEPHGHGRQRGPEAQQSHGTLLPSTVSTLAAVGVPARRYRGPLVRRVATMSTKECPSCGA